MSSNQKTNNTNISCNATNNTIQKKPTPVQTFFQENMNELATLNYLSTQQTLTPEEQRKKDQILTDLWNKIEKYATSVCKIKLNTYDKHNQHIEDMIQHSAYKFLEQLPKYDPQKSTPVTFFNPYFLEAASNYIRKEIQHLTANDANNTRKIRTATQILELRNMTNPDASSLSAETGLSLKVVNNTLKLMQNSATVNIDDLPHLISKEKTPEEHFLENESLNLLCNIIREALTDYELNFFYDKVYLKGDKELTYTKMSQLYSIPMHEVKLTWNQIREKIISHPKMEYFLK